MILSASVLYFQLERSFPMKTKLDRYDLSILIKGLYSMRDCYGSEIRDQIYNLLSTRKSS